MLLPIGVTLWPLTSKHTDAVMLLPVPGGALGHWGRLWGQPQRRPILRQRAGVP